MSECYKHESFNKCYYESAGRFSRKCLDCCNNLASYVSIIVPFFFFRQFNMDFRSKRRKKFKEYSEGYQNRLVNERFGQELDIKLESSNSEQNQYLIDNAAVADEVENFNEQKNLNDKPLFGNNLKENEEINDIDSYLYKKIYDEFCDGYGLDIDKEQDKVHFEGKEYSYSDSSDSESNSESDDDDFDLTEELKGVGRNMHRDDLTNLLKILKIAGHEDLPNTAEQLLNTPKVTIITKCQSGEYLHYGLIRCLEDLLKRGIILPKIIILDIGIDGVPLSKSNNRKLWPIVGRIRNLPRLAPFLIGAYHGFCSPTSSNPFLQPFIDEYKELENKEIIIGLTKHRVQLKSVICDTPGRCMVRGTKGYDGYEGCCRCIVYGDWRKKVVFLHENAELRTDKSFRERKFPGHHNETSAFEQLNIDMVQSFPLDYMHTVCLGVVRLLLMTWFRSKNPLLSAIAIKSLSDDLVSLGKSIPKEFNRKTANLNELGR